MTSHELAKLLLTLPDLPFCSSAMGHIYSEEMSAISHGPLMVGILAAYRGDHTIVGNMIKLIDNSTNWKIREVLYTGPMPDLLDFPRFQMDTTARLEAVERELAKRHPSDPSDSECWPELGPTMEHSPGFNQPICQAIAQAVSHSPLSHTPLSALLASGEYKRFDVQIEPDGTSVYTEISGNFSRKEK